MTKQKDIFDISKIDSNQVYKIIEGSWPTNISGIARELGFNIHEGNQKKVVARLSYHVNKLKKDEKIHTKKIDRAVVIWPHDIERIRFIHEMMR